MNFKGEFFRTALERIPGTRDYKARIEKRARLLEDLDRIEGLQADADFQWWLKRQLTPYIQSCRSMVLRSDTPIAETVIYRHLIPILAGLGADLEATRKTIRAEAERLETELRRDIDG